MAQEENNEDQAVNVGDADQKRGRGPVKVLGGLVALIATGSALAMMAIPSKAAPLRMTGPLEFAPLENDDEPRVVATIPDDNYSRYITFTPSTIVFAYDPAYPAARQAEQGFSHAMRSAISKTTMKYFLAEIFSHLDEFNEELRQSTERVLFPVCFGEAELTYMADPASGLFAGDSQGTRGTFRGDFYASELKVDAPGKTVQLGEGPAATFHGAETDLMVEDRFGASLYVNVTDLPSDFVGTVQVGVKGRIRRFVTGNIQAQ